MRKQNETSKQTIKNATSEDNYGAIIVQVSLRHAYGRVTSLYA